jgi:hypothetical protein
MSLTDWIALCSVIVAVVAAVIAWRQKRDGQRAAEAAERSAHAAEQSADIAARGERAWLVVQRVESSPDLHEHIVLRAVVTLVNNGKTPARELRTWQKIELRTAPPSNADYPEKLAEGSKGVLGAGEPCQIPAIFEPTHHEFTEIVAHRSTAFLYGVAEYQDLIFNRCNRTCWCLHYVPESKEYTYSDCDNSVS